MADKFIKSITFVKGGDTYYHLPKVTNADDGKVLKVVDGVWRLNYLIPNPPSYLSFIGNEDFTLKTGNTTKNWDGTLEYSTDAITWNIWNGSDISSAGSKLYLRGTGNTRITGNSNDYRFIFTGTNSLKVACEGNIENLLDYKTVSAGGHPTMANSCYQSMFYGCTSLTTAPELPATTLAERCYAYMFNGCTSLTTAPELPATTLVDSCYSNMFRECTSITAAPDLPATTLADYCYNGMFRDCTSLRSAPALPATTLVNGCYYNMFYRCTSLTTAPALPATTLVNYCYQIMFAGCTKIKLSATQTGEYQTAYRIPKSGTGTIATDALLGIFINTGGTFKGTPSINTTYYLSTSNTVV